MSLTWSTVQFRLQNRVSGFLLFSVGRGFVGIPLTVAGIRGVCGHLSILKAHRPVGSPFLPVVCWDSGGAAALNSNFTA